MIWKRVHRECNPWDFEKKEQSFCYGNFGDRGIQKFKSYLPILAMEYIMIIAPWLILRMLPMLFILRPVRWC